MSRTYRTASLGIAVAALAGGFARAVPAKEEPPAAPRSLILKAPAKPREQGAKEKARRLRQMAKAKGCDSPPQ